MFSPDEVYSISDFIQLCKKTLNQQIPSCWLSGEVSNLSMPNSGHVYFSLKDNNAQIRCALFKLTKKRIQFTLENGQSILVYANPTIYEARGDFQVIINQVEALGVGNLQHAFEQLKKRLMDEGLFDEKHKKPLPESVQTIGIITSKTGAVIHDIIQVLKRRQPDITVYLFHTNTQGQDCPNAITKTLTYADEQQCDVLIVARGGGSLEDLWCFNEESVVRTIFALTTPIISAIGHQTDTTISDFVADIRAATPSIAAEIISTDMSERQQKLTQLTHQLNYHLRLILNQYKTHIIELKQKLNQSNYDLDKLNLHLGYLSSQMNRHLLAHIKQHQNTLTILNQKLLKQSPYHQMNEQHSKLQYLTQMLTHYTQQYLNKKKQQISQLNQRQAHLVEQQITHNQQQLQSLINGLNHLNPLQILKRGFSISFDKNDQIISNADQLEIGQTLRVLFKKGTIISTVTHKK